MTKLDVLKKEFQAAVLRLEEVLKQPKNEFIRDSAIQRFEFCFDLSWKFLKTHLEEIHGVIVASPKKCFREAYKLQLIEYDSLWIHMTDDRNAIAHMYKEARADELYEKLPKYLANFQKLMSLG